MKEQVLADLGLSKNESRIYLSLLENGAATMTKIAELSGIHRVNVYDSVEKLKNKGLVGQMNFDGKKQYQASPPEMLRNLIKEKEIHLEQVLPQLTLSNQLAANDYTIQIYRGFDFIRNMFIHFLEVGEPIYDLNIPKFVLDQLGAHGMSGKYFQEEIHKQRARKKQMMYHLYRKDAMERIRFLNTLPYTEARYLEEEHDPDSNVVTAICGDEVAISIRYRNNDQKPLIIFIKNKDIAATYRVHFMTLWSIAKKPEEDPKEIKDPKENISPPSLEQQRSGISRKTSLKQGNEQSE